MAMILFVALGFCCFNLDLRRFTGPLVVSEWYGRCDIKKSGVLVGGVQLKDPGKSSKPIWKSLEP